MMTEMKMLLWKDFQLSKLCLLAGMMFIIGPYMLIFDPYIFWYDFTHAWLVSAAISQLTMVLVAGNIISCERADRSAAFLAYQGITRKKIITSKLIICSITFILIYVISFIPSFWLKMSEFRESEDDLRIIQAFYFATGFCFFGCCWLLSDLLTNPVAAIVFGLCPPLFIGCVLGYTSEYLHWPRIIEVPYWYIVFVTAAGLISLVAGTWHFIRSKES
jgi:ABC-type transport system involved in multi-copper enzyme maturation permease subunit